MNRREFGLGVAAVATSAMLPEPDIYFDLRPLVWDNITHDGTDFNIQFTSSSWWNHRGVCLDKVVIKELRKAWEECERV